MYDVNLTLTFLFSGAGKTTLFNVLSKRDNDYDVYGDLRLNGARYDSDHLKMISGFVWQESLYLSHLTPREALLFNARLKLPKVVSKAEREKRVDDLIRAFDLEKCKSTFIGDDMLKGTTETISTVSIIYGLNSSFNDF